MGHGYSGSVSESQGPIFLQAMGRRTKEESRSHARRSHVGRNAGQFGESVNNLTTKVTKGTKVYLKF